MILQTDWAPPRQILYLEKEALCRFYDFLWYPCNLTDVSKRLLATITENVIFKKNTNSSRLIVGFR